MLRPLWIRTLYGMAIGMMSGISTALFLHLLYHVTHYRVVMPWIILGLPFAGAGIVWAYNRYGRGAEKGNILILEEIENPKQTLPWTMGPLVVVSTLVTHLFGGSAGREGTAIQISATLADHLQKTFHIPSSERKNILMAGSAAGFGAAIGTPFAGMLFGMEVLYKHKNPISTYRSAWYPCLLSAYTATWFSHFLQAPHSTYASPIIPPFSLYLFGCVVLLGVCFGILSRLFVSLTVSIRNTYIHLQQRLYKHTSVSYRPYLYLLPPLFGGLFLLIAYGVHGSLRDAGLGIETIQMALIQPSPWWDSFLKLGYSALTLGSGFKGGEFTPLVFIGTTFGSALSPYLHFSAGFLGALGFTAVFGAASKTPLSCAVMAAEVFGWLFFPHALLCGYVAYGMSGNFGIYKKPAAPQFPTLQEKSE